MFNSSVEYHYESIDFTPIKQSKSLWRFLNEKLLNRQKMTEKCLKTNEEWKIHREEGVIDEMVLLSLLSQPLKSFFYFKILNLFRQDSKRNHFRSKKCKEKSKW